MEQALTFQSVVLPTANYLNEMMGLQLSFICTKDHFPHQKLNKTVGNKVRKHDHVDHTCTFSHSAHRSFYPVTSLSQPLIVTLLR